MSIIYDDGRKVCFATLSGIYVWDRAWEPKQPPDLRSKVWCAPCILADISKRYPVVRRESIIAQQYC